MPAPAVWFDRTKETTATTGTGTFTLGGTTTGYQAFSAHVPTGSTIHYAASDGTNWEVGIGTYTLSGTTLSRTTVLASSNAGALVSFPGPTTQVWIDETAADVTNTILNGTAMTKAQAVQPGAGLLTLYPDDGTATGSARGWVGLANAGKFPLGTYSINVVCYGATGNGSTDDTAAINAAIVAANAFQALSGTQRGCRVHFPAGIFLISAALTTVNANGIIFSGEGRGATTLLITATTGDIFSFTAGNEYCEFRDLQFFASVTRSAGAFINTSGADDFVIERFVMSGAFVGINVGTAANPTLKVNIKQGVISSTVAATGVGVLVVNGAGGDTYIGPDIIMSNSSGARPLAGIRVQQTGHTRLQGCNVSNCVSGLQIDPQTSQDASYLFVDHCLFDSCGTQGLLVNPANVASARFRSARFDGSWFSGSSTGNGILMSSAGSAAIVDDITFKNCRMLNNGLNGVSVAFGTNICIDNCSIAGNSVSSSNVSDGIVVSAAITDFRLVDNRVGPVGTATNTQRFGINILAGASDRYIVRQNDLRGNGNGAGTGGAFFNGGTGLQQIIGDNLGGPLNGLPMTAASAAINTTDTVLVKAPAGSNGMNIGTTWSMKFFGTCTASAANVSTFTVRLGTAGTTGDTTIATFTVTSAATGTTIPFEIEIILTARAVGSTTTVAGQMTVLSQGLATGTSSGIAAFSTNCFSTASVASGNSAANDTILSVSYKSAATSTTSTFQQGQIFLRRAA
jgi:hypothetical protein